MSHLNGDLLDLIEELKNIEIVEEVRFYLSSKDDYQTIDVIYICNYTDVVRFTEKYYYTSEGFML